MEKLNNLKPLISRNEELYISKEAKKENALASVGKSWRPDRGTQREYSSKPLNHGIVESILVFKR